MTHLKLQKLIYYVQGFALVILKTPLFNERMEAWPHGPVVRIFTRNTKDIETILLRISTTNLGMQIVLAISSEN